MTTVLSFLEEMLRELGFTSIQSFSCPLKAKEAIFKASYDLIISDIKMPGMTGLELLAEVKEKNIETPFIIMSTSNENETVFAALEGGAANYLIKPLSLELVKKKIFKTLQLS